MDPLDWREGKHDGKEDKRTIKMARGRNHASGPFLRDLQRCFLYMVIGMGGRGEDSRYNFPRVPCRERVIETGANGTHSVKREILENGLNGRHCASEPARRLSGGAACVEDRPC